MCGSWNFAVTLSLLLTTAATCCLAGETGAATLRTQGYVTVNQATVPAFSAIFVNSQIETGKNSSAIMDLTGSRVEIGPETMVEFDGDEFTLDDGLSVQTSHMSLDHGRLTVQTSRSLSVKIGCVTAIPVRSEETQFTVQDYTGQFTVVSSSGEVTVKASFKDPKLMAKSGKPEEQTVRPGQPASGDERCGASPPQTGAARAGVGALLNSPYAIGTGAGLIGGGLYWVLSKCDDPASPATPSATACH